jgi:hypothetical protein
MKVWISKYALTVGLYTREVELVSPKMVSVIGARPSEYYHKPNWHETRTAAVDHAVQLKARMLMSLKRKIIKLGNLSFDSWLR